jgi:hypothetical protein
MSYLVTAAGKGGPLTVVEADANLTALDTRTADGWMDIVSELFARDAPGCAEGDEYDGVGVWRYDPDVTRRMFVNFHMPHPWKPGTMLYPHLHFTVTSSAGGVVRLGFRYKWSRRHDSTGQRTFTAAETLYINFTIPPNSQDTHFVAEIPQGQGIPGTGLEVDSMIMMTVIRDGEHVDDTFPAGIFAITADIHIEVDRASTPQRAPDFYTA